MQKDFRQIQAELAKPFAPEDLEWRIQVTSQDKSKGLAVPYVTNRAIQDRLDEVVGSENWRNEYRPWHKGEKKEAQLCGISIYLEERKEWLTKWDGSEDSDIEPVKGGLSDSMKRAAVQFGIGRVLYKMNTVWVQVEQKGRSVVIKDAERPRLDKAYLDMLNRLGMLPAQAGALQAQLTPMQDSAAPQTATKQEAPTPPRKSAPPPASGKVTQFPVQRLTWQYKVVSVKVQPGMSQPPSMMLTLATPDGAQLRAFYPKEARELTQGALLCDVELSQRKQGSVVFNLLKSYRVIPNERAA